MKRITLVCAAMLAAGTASAADCKRFTDLIGPVSRNFEGVAITKMTQTWNIMAQPVLAADNCTILRKGEAHRDRAATHCVWLMPKASEQAARAAYDAWAGSLLACRSGQQAMSSTKAMRPLEVARLVTKDAQDNEGWLVNLSRGEKEGWVVGVMGSMRQPGTLAPAVTAAPTYQPSSSATPPVYRPSSAPPVPVIRTAPPAAPTVSAACAPLQEMVQMAQTGREAPGSSSFGDIDNRTTLSKKFFGGQGCTGTSRKNAPGAHSVNCATLGLSSDHKSWSKRVASERATLVEACFPGFRRMNSPYGAWFTSTDGTLEVSATWNEQTGFSMVETTVSYTPRK